MTETEAEAYVRYSAELDLAWQKRLLAVEADMERIAADRDRWCDLAASRAKQNAELQAELDKALLAAEETAGGAVKLAKSWSEEIADLRERTYRAADLLEGALCGAEAHDSWRASVETFIASARGPA